jgi:hypothetical protein
LPTHLRLEVAATEVVIPGRAGFIARRGVDANRLELLDNDGGDALLLDEGFVGRDVYR